MSLVLKNDADDNWGPGCTLDILRKRAWMLSSIRHFFVVRNVLEVETPILGQTTGTEPQLNFFSTKYAGSPDTSDGTFFFQTSPEFAMKRLLARGIGSIYQICKAFRNHECGRLHNPEFTILEWYRVGFDLNQLMKEIEELILGLFAHSQVTLSASEHISYFEAFSKYTELDVPSASVSDFIQVAKIHSLDGAVDLCRDEVSDWLDFLFSQLVQPHLGKDRLTFIFDYPMCHASLARLKPGETDIAERFEVFINGIELGNGYCELTDAIEQEQRFRHDLHQRRKRNLPTPTLDKRLIKSLEHGLPECSGVAIGLDRLLMLLTGTKHIDEVLAFDINRA